MAKKRYVDTKFWSDSYITDLDPLERYLFLYFLTNEHTNLCGIYEIPLRVMAFETGIDTTALTNMLGRFEKDKKILYKNNWIAITNFIKNQVLNPSVMEGIQRELSEVPPELKVLLDTSPIQLGDSLGTAKLSKVRLSKVRYGEVDLENAKFLYELIKGNNPAWYVDPNWDQWAEDMRKIREIDNRTPEQIKFIIQWSQQDSFWHKNILSPEKLRKQFNTLVVQAKAKSVGNRPKMDL